MRKSLIFSALLHLTVLLLVVFGLPRLWERTPPAEAPIVIEVVNLDDKTTAKEPPKRPPPKKKKKVKKLPPPAPPKIKHRARDIPPPPAPSKPVMRPEPKAEKVPVKKAPKPKKTPPKPPKPKKKPEAKVPPKQIAKARPRHKPLAPKEDFLQSVLRDVAPEERTPEPRKPVKKKNKKREPLPLPDELKSRRAPIAPQVTTSEIDAIRRQIERCWIIPAGARDAQDLVVSIRVWVNPDGSISRANILDTNRLRSDPFFRTAAESAMRAVLNPRCSPLQIPPKKYDQFKVMVLDFNPREAAGS